MRVWNGLCSGRRDLHATTAPKHAEYVAIVREIQGIQQFLVDCTGGEAPAEETPATPPTLLQQFEALSDEDRSAFKKLLFRS